MTIALHLETLEAAATPLPPIDYRWDAETEILCARLRAPAAAARTASGVAVDGATTGTVELCGTDGSWLMLDVDALQLRGVEVAVWPALATRPGLRPPRDVPAARARVRPGRLTPRDADAAAAVAVRAESDERAGTLHFRVGCAAVASTVRIGGDFLLDLDARSRLAGLWLLNVPPAPSHA